MANRRTSSPIHGLARRLANDLEIPPQLAVRAGERAVAAMIDLKRAHDAGSGILREQCVAQAQQHMAHIDAQHHDTLLQHLQGCVVALGGRASDTRIAHVTQGEVVIPEQLQTPEALAALHAAASVEGIDPNRFRVGSDRNSINPHTGQMEFNDADQNLCRLADGRLVPYKDLAFGYITTNGGGMATEGLGAAAGQVGANANMPTVPKPGGLAGGGESGKWTSHASRILRDVTGGSRINPLPPITGNMSVGGTAARALPLLGAGLSLDDYLKTQDALKNAPICKPFT